jgi:hypothetical protein
MADAKILWCCHVRGPDDVYAAPDYETALRWSDIMNECNWMRGKDRQPPSSWADCLIKASPAIWPWSAQAHRANVPRSVRDFALPTPTAQQEGR